MTFTLILGIILMLSLGITVAFPKYENALRYGWSWTFLASATISILLLAVKLFGIPENISPTPANLEIFQSFAANLLTSYTIGYVLARIFDLSDPRLRSLPANAYFHTLIGAPILIGIHAQEISEPTMSWMLNAGTTIGLVLLIASPLQTHRQLNLKG